MFGSPYNGANAYAKVSVETGVGAASPHQLIVMLFEGAMVAITSGLQCMQAGDTRQKGAAISQAISIIENGLRASLDKKVGGDIALNLDALYGYMSSRLLTANLKNQPEILEEVLQLLKGLKDAWASITPDASTTAPAPPQAAPVRQPDALAPRAPHLAKA